MGYLANKGGIAMKRMLLGQAAFYLIFFFLFFFLTLHTLNRYGGWNLLSLINVLIATSDLIRASKLIILYFNLRPKK